jgi:hypothetical protein
MAGISYRNEISPLGNGGETLILASFGFAGVNS